MYIQSTKTKHTIYIETYNFKSIQSTKNQSTKAESLKKKPKQIDY